MQHQPGDHAQLHLGMAAPAASASSAADADAAYLPYIPHFLKACRKFLHCSTNGIALKGTLMVCRDKVKRYTVDNFHVTQPQTKKCVKTFLQKILSTSKPFPTRTWKLQKSNWRLRLGPACLKDSESVRQRTLGRCPTAFASSVRGSARCAGFAPHSFAVSKGWVTCGNLWALCSQYSIDTGH